MKMHIGVDDALGLIHSVSAAAANVHDITQADQVLHGEERRVFDYDKVRYRGLEKNGERLHMLAAFTHLVVGKNTCSHRSVSPVDLRMAIYRQGSGRKLAPKI